MDTFLGTIRAWKDSPKENRRSRIAFLETTANAERPSATARTADLLRGFMQLQGENDDDINAAETVFRSLIAGAPDTWQAGLAHIGLIGVFSEQGNHAAIVQEAELVVSQVDLAKIENDPEFRRARDVLSIKLDDLMRGVRESLSISRREVSRTVASSIVHPGRHDASQIALTPQCSNVSKERRSSASELKKITSSCYVKRCVWIPIATLVFCLGGFAAWRVVKRRRQDERPSSGPM
ncbi:MAG: hypothetical protein WA117_15700 [Verrucomicrobiia bacterium]